MSKSYDKGPEPEKLAVSLANLFRLSSHAIEETFSLMPGADKAIKGRVLDARDGLVSLIKCARAIYDGDNDFIDDKQLTRDILGQEPIKIIGKLDPAIYADRGVDTAMRASLVRMANGGAHTVKRNERYPFFVRSDQTANILSIMVTRREIELDLGDEQLADLDDIDPRGIHYAATFERYDRYRL